MRILPLNSVDLNYHSEVIKRKNSGYFGILVNIKMSHLFYHQQKEVLNPND